MVPGFSLLIIVPTLDSFEYLPRLTSSLQAQTFKNWRVLFVDGQSSNDHRLWIQNFCISESRAFWIEQDPEENGIFGAMNQGFASAMPSDWVLFWGSDDWAVSSTVFADVVASLEVASSRQMLPDLLVCKARYVYLNSRSRKRASVFCCSGLMFHGAYRRALMLGSTPPHQATFFGPGARKCLDRYADCFRLSADLDYFLRLSSHRGICVQCLNVELVYMLSGGISAIQTQRRLAEVAQAYQHAFGLLWLLPFLMRYLRRLLSLLPSWT
jgi:glycosyltransferase involved in cell wall biosynthesis